MERSGSGYSAIGPSRVSSRPGCAFWEDAGDWAMAWVHTANTAIRDSHPSEERRHGVHESGPKGQSHGPESD